jgi:uncharacterized protein
VSEAGAPVILLDGNALVALAVADHVHHAAVWQWFTKVARFATCPITQGTLLRFLLREGFRVATGLAFLRALAARPGFEFWPDDAPYDAPMLESVIGHRQVTDAYLAALARRRGGRIATFDAGLAATHADAAVLVPTSTR